MRLHSPSTLTGDPGPCASCGRPCYPVPSGYFRHGEPCGFWMPFVGEPCARRKGHAWEHRSRFALDNAARPGRWVTAA